VATGFGALEACAGRYTRKGGEMKEWRSRLPRVLGFFGSEPEPGYSVSAAPPTRPALPEPSVEDLYEQDDRN